MYNFYKDNDESFYITDLLHNFIFKTSSLNLEIKSDIIVETNFKVYVYYSKDIDKIDKEFLE